MKRKKPAPTNPATVDVATDAAGKPGWKRHTWIVVAALMLALLGALALYWRSGKSPPATTPATTNAQAAHYVGSQQCSSCHADATRDWQQSQHAKAMQHANAQTVLADFNDTRFVHNGVTSRFFKRGDEFWVNTDGADGKLADFRIAYTFGLYPLQQYLVAFADGRVQALPIAWDTRDAAQGGQHWFHMYPDEKIDFRDELHWTGPQQNWNYMCADCHSTNLRRNFNVDDNRFATTWSEISVGCETCHGPGSNHLAWANGGAPAATADKGLSIALDARRQGSWLPTAGTGNVHRSQPLANHTEAETCAVCHSRRYSISSQPGPTGQLLDTHNLSLLTEDLYFDDGQQKDEVFIHGSFLQSKMYAQGVTCSDCHNPHTGQLKLQGNATCTQCHAPATYDTPKHHFHQASTQSGTNGDGKGDGSQCVDCHMPARTYMVNDPRRDHSFRVPRPDLSVSIGTPNACQSCHADKDDRWAAQAVERWHGPQRKGFQQWATAFHAARHGAADAAAQLTAVFDNPQTPAIARATALQELRQYPGNALLRAINKGLSDPSPLVRMAAIDALPAGASPPAAAFRLLDDPLLAVRATAGQALAGTPPAQLPAGRDGALLAAIKDYEAGQQATASRAEAHVNLANIHARQGEALQAEADLQTALRLNPDFAASYINLADLYRASGRDGQGQQILEQGLKRLPEQPDLLYAYALQRVRAGDSPAALQLLQRAVRQAPDNMQIVYVYAVALHSAGQLQASNAVLDAGLQRRPNQPDLLFARASFARDSGDLAQARIFATRLLEAAPDDPRALELQRQLQMQTDG